MTLENQVYNELEQRVHEAQTKNLEMEKLVNAFLSNISHEIRTPLNSILGFAELLREPDLSDEEREEYFGYIDTKCNYLLNFIDNVLDLAKIEARELTLSCEYFDLNPLMKELYQYYLAELKKFRKEHIKLILNEDKSLDTLEIYSDRKRVKQILSNFLSNAIKFTNQGYIEFGYQVKSLNQIEIFVNDTGIGIPAERKNEIFEKFKVLNLALSKKIGGAGLGLTISRHLAQLLGGEIYFHSRENYGTSFYLLLPVSIPDAKPPEPIKNEYTNKFNWEEKIILVAEDVEMNYMFIEAALKKTKAKVIWARSGDEAIQIVQNSLKKGKKVDLIIMDIQMPDMDGYEATQQIKHIANDTVIISHTAFEFEEDMHKSLQAGCDDYLPKPVTPDILIDKISKYLNN